MKTLLFVVIIFLYGCKEKSVQPNDTDCVLNGTYAGVFSLIQNENVLSGNVTFFFKDTTYSCIPETALLPPTGGGKFEIAGNKIILTDMAVHTANFDWTLILNGEFSYTNRNNVIVMIQADTVHHRYRKIELTNTSK